MQIRAIVIAVCSVFTLWLASSQSHAAGMPTATTLGATNITSSSAQVNGQANPNGATTMIYFELGTTTAYGNSTPTVNGGNGTLPVAALADFLGLSPNTLYHYRVVAYNSFGTNFGLDATFTTLAGPQIPPTVTTLGATNITTSSVRVNGEVNPNGFTTSGYFELGPTTGYGISTPPINFGNGTGISTTFADFSGLNPNTLYHYRVVAYNLNGTNFGQDATFTTMAGPPVPPTVTTLGATNITTSSVTINGQINPNGAATTGYFQLGTTTNYSDSTVTFSAGSGASPVSVNAEFAELFPGTLYHYRLVGYNSFGTNFGQDATFTTLAGLPIAPVMVNSNLLAPGHLVRLRQAAPAFGTVTNITGAEALLNLAATNSAVAFDAYDVGVSTVNYSDFATSPSPQGLFGLDRDIHVIPGNSAPASDQDNYAIDVSGYLYIPQAGSWSFYIHSDEGFRLRMGAANAVVTEFPGTRTAAQSAGVVSVPSAGWYPYQLTYFEQTGGSEVELSVSAPAQGIRRLVGDLLDPVLVYHLIEAPRLNIARQADQVVVSWPIKSGAGTLQSNTNLVSSAWVPVGPAPAVSAGQYVVTNSANLPALFYRLKLP